jgi:hypothetical protein
MTHLTPEKWRRLVEKELGKIPDVVWLTLVKKQFIDYANKEAYQEGRDSGLDYLLEQVESEMLSYHAYAHTGPRLPQDAPKKPPRELLPQKEKPPDTQAAAYSKIIACLLNKEEPIQQFRSRFLSGNMLAPTEALPWIKATSATEAPDQEISITFSASKDIGRDHNSIAAECLQAARAGLVSSIKYSFPTLSCIASDGSKTDTIPIASRGTLAELKLLAKKYEAFWPEAAAVHFILTGQGYLTRRAVAHYGSDKHSIPWVSLRLHPSLSGDEVRSLYLAARNCLEGWPGNINPKGLTEKHLALAVHAVEHAGSWAAKLWKWNKTCPAEWVYLVPARSTFARDCRAAYERLTGWKWQEETKK